MSNRKETVVVEIDEETGAMTIGAENVVGPHCKQLTAEFEQAVGVVTNDVKRPEFFQQAKNVNRAGKPNIAGH